MIDIQHIITSAINRELQKRSLSQNKMASEIGISQTHLNDVISGRKSLGIKSLECLLSARPDWIDLIDPRKN